MLSFATILQKTRTPADLRLKPLEGDRPMFHFATNTDLFAYAIILVNRGTAIAGPAEHDRYLQGGNAMRLKVLWKAALVVLLLALSGCPENMQGSGSTSSSGGG